MASVYSSLERWVCCATGRVEYRRAACGPAESRVPRGFPVGLL